MGPDNAELRGRLGIRPEATPAEVLATCRELEGFLAPERVPGRLRPWAKQQLEHARRLATAATGAPRDAAPAPPPGAGAEGLPDLFGEDETAFARPAARKGAAGARSRAGVAPPRRRSSAWRTVVLVIALAAVVVGLVVGNPSLFSGLTSAAPAAPAAPGTTTAALDTARVATLEAVVQKNPGDADALFELGEMHFQARRYQDSIDWFTRLLAVDPGNLHARLDVGTANFNLGRLDQARTAWEDAAARDPSDPQVHYNLGFLYANSPTPDLDRAFQEWEKVIQLAPGSDLAKTAQAHLDGLRAK